MRSMYPDEADRVAELAVELQKYQKMKEICRLPTCENFNEELVSNGKPHKYGTFVAVAIDSNKENTLDKSQVVGYVIYSQIFSLYNGRSFWINSFFIEEDYRRHGLGTKFMEYIKAHALSTGNNQLEVPFMNDNVKGQKFYKNHGAYKVNEDHILMGKDLDDRIM